MHTLGIRMFAIPSCISIHIRGFPLYCSIYDITHYLTPLHQHQPSPVLGKLAHPQGTSAHPMKYTKEVSKQSFNSTHINTVVTYRIQITPSALFVQPLATHSLLDQFLPGPIFVKYHRGTGCRRWTELHRWTRLHY